MDTRKPMTFDSVRELLEAAGADVMTRSGWSENRVNSPLKSAASFPMGSNWTSSPASLPTATHERQPAGSMISLTPHC